MRNREMRDPESTRIKDKIVIGPKMGLKSHSGQDLRPKWKYHKLSANGREIGVQNTIMKTKTPKMGFCLGQIRP